MWRVSGGKGTDVTGPGSLSKCVGGEREALNKDCEWDTNCGFSLSALYFQSQIMSDPCIQSLTIPGCGFFSQKEKETEIEKK